MSYLIHFIPIIFFILLFVGTGIYFTLLDIPNAFYQFSPITAILPAIAMAWALHRGTTQQKMHEINLELGLQGLVFKLNKAHV